MRVYESCVGLNTIVAPHQIPYTSGEKVWLASCSNIDITDAHKIRRRDGVGLVRAQSYGGCSSCFDAGDFIVYVEGDALSIRDRSGTTTQLRTVTRGAPMSCVRMLQGIFHTNGVEHGIIRSDRLAYAWSPLVSDVNITIAKSYAEPQVGHLLAEFGGSLLYAYQDYIFKSKPYNPFLFNFDEDRQPVDSPARMIKEVEGGMWVSDQEQIMFFSGRDFLNLERFPRHAKPAVQGTDVYVEQNEVIPDLPKGRGVLVTAEDAILLLATDGTAYDRSTRKITIPSGATGTAMIRGGQYLSLIHI